MATVARSFPLQIRGWTRSATTALRFTRQLQRCAPFLTLSGHEQQRPRVAVLYQELDPPLVNGTRKPKKPGGYQDSGADIACALKTAGLADVITPITNPDPENQTGWTFGDTEEGILDALGQGATHLWANTILFASHPLQVSARIAAYENVVRIIGQPPRIVEQGDDKDYVNSMLRRNGGFTLPRGWTLPADEPIEQQLDLATLPFPVVAKPSRGRGSYGVQVCSTAEELKQHIENLHGEGMTVMVEEFLAGEEATVTVMPPCPSLGHDTYWALPVVARFNHQGGIAPYNGAVAVTSNSRVIAPAPGDLKYTGNPSIAKLLEECVHVADLLHTTAPIRIDVRRVSREKDASFALFDVNMKPNMTGPGRPGRDDQASLTLMAAQALGWDYPTLLYHILHTAGLLRDVRNVKLDW